MKAYAVVALEGDIDVTPSDLTEVRFFASREAAVERALEYLKLDHARGDVSPETMESEIREASGWDGTGARAIGDILRLCELEVME